jgi:hypothetical protein
VKRWLRRWLGVDAPSPSSAPPSRPPGKSLTRIARLEERVDFLEGALNRLRGQVTGGQRSNPKPQEEPQSAQDAPGPTIDASPIAEPQPDRWMGLAAHRRAKNGVLPR